MFYCNLFMTTSLGFEHTLLIQRSQFLKSLIHSILNTSGRLEEGSGGGGTTSSLSSLTITLDLCEVTVGPGEVIPSENDAAPFWSWSSVFWMCCSMAVNLELVRACKMSWFTVSEVLTSVLVPEALISESTLFFNWHFTPTGRLC